MNELSERRLVENELVFRHHNNKQKNRQRRESSVDDSELYVDFYCECSSRTCHERIPISVEEYEDAHKSNKQFIALPGHADKAIEEVIKAKSGFNVIQKYTDPVQVVD